jgi:hypothetical protein
LASHFERQAYQHIVSVTIFEDQACNKHTMVQARLAASSTVRLFLKARLAMHLFGEAEQTNNNRKACQKCDSTAVVGGRACNMYSSAKELMCLPT